MKKDFCDKCGKEIELRDHRQDVISPHIKGGEFQYSLKYAFYGDLSLHGIENKNEFCKTFDLCVPCTLKLIESITDIGTSTIEGR